MDIPTTIESIEAMSGLDRNLRHSQIEYVIDGIINIVFCKLQSDDSGIDTVIAETL